MLQIDQVLTKLEKIGQNGLPVEHKLESNTLSVLAGSVVLGAVILGGIIGACIYFSRR